MAEQKAKVVKVGRGGPRGPRPKVQNPGKIFMRILRYVMECYRLCPGPYDGLRYPGHPEAPAR